MQKGLISIITPFYNSELYVEKLLDSVLSQDYPSVEMIAIDDGSTDNTLAIIESYIPQFKNKGYTLKCIHQSNQGQSVAVDNGLKLVDGEYLVWPDSDDWYTYRKAFSTFVKTFESLPEEYAVVRCLPIYCYENDEPDVELPINQVWFEQDQFLNCLYDKNFIWPPIHYMVKLHSLNLVLKERSIYTEKNAGQNWQILLPLLKSYKCHTIKSHFCKVLIRENSHSRGQFSGEARIIQKFNSYHSTIIATLSRLNNIDEKTRAFYMSEIHRKYNRIKFDIAYQAKNVDLLQYCMLGISKTEHTVSLNYRLRYILVRYPLLHSLAKALHVFFNLKNGAHKNKG